MDPNDFKSGMRRLAAGVSLITCECNGVRHGLIATAVTSLSAEPPSLLICVNASASIHEHLSEAESFCVNVLSREQQDVATRFATPKDRETRFEIGDWSELETGAPALRGAQVSFDCRPAQKSVFGTHTIFIGEVVAVTDWGSASDPLLYHDGRFESLTKTESV
ncbi:flavin reductase family protein [Alloyangia pacifica]|uniref:flavin reductase family protein n=1 Tax=Alloyangia pacifica TaxID=311180 RepID=UPI001CFF464B|nr:flavin reductase family protein [Alloyangia pacifica]